MLTFKYVKKDSSVYTSHIDMLRVLNRAVKRADIEASYSQGFNPHMLIFMSAPLATGISSVAEYFTLVTDSSIEGIVEKYNLTSPISLQAIDCFFTTKNPNVSGKTVASRYFLYNEEVIKYKQNIENILNLNSYVITYIQKGNETQKEVRNLIYDIKVNEKGIELLLASGNNNLRADRLLNNILKPLNINYYPISILRIAQYTQNENGDLIDIDDYLKSLN